MKPVPRVTRAMQEMSKVERGQDLSSRYLQIPSIERDSGIMEAQFARELTSLGDRLTREAEEATFWEKKYSTLDQRYPKTDTDLRILQHDMAARETQLEERDRDISTRISSLKIDRDAFREGYNSTQRRLEDKEQEVDELWNQVKGLKEFVSTNTRTEGQITDEAFAELMQNLGNGLQNWVISSFRRTKIDLSKLSKLGPDPQGQLSGLLCIYTNVEAISKVHLIQSVVPSIFINHIFNSYFAGLPREICATLTDMECSLRSLVSETSVNQWRSTTLAVLKKDALEKVRTETEILVSSVVQQISTTLNSFNGSSRITNMERITPESHLRCHRTISIIESPESSISS